MAGAESLSTTGLPRMLHWSPFSWAERRVVQVRVGEADDRREGRAAHRPPGVLAVLDRQREVHGQEVGVHDRAGRARELGRVVRGLGEQALDLGRAVARDRVDAGLLLDVLGHPAEQHVLAAGDAVDPLLGRALVGVVVVAGERRAGEGRRVLLAAGAGLGRVRDHAVGALVGQLDDDVAGEPEERGVAEDRVDLAHLLDQLGVRRLGDDVAAVGVGGRERGVADLAGLDVVAEVRHLGLAGRLAGAGQRAAALDDLAQLGELGVLHLAGGVFQGVDLAHQPHQLVALVLGDVAVLVAQGVDGLGLALQALGLVLERPVVVPGLHRFLPSENLTNRSPASTSLRRGLASAAVAAAPASAAGSAVHASVVAWSGTRPASSISAGGSASIACAGGRR